MNKNEKSEKDKKFHRNSSYTKITNFSLGNFSVEAPSLRFSKKEAIREQLNQPQIPKNGYFSKLVFVIDMLRVQLLINPVST